MWTAISEQSASAQVTPATTGSVSYIVAQNLPRGQAIVHSAAIHSEQIRDQPFILLALLGLDGLQIVCFRGLSFSTYFQFGI